MHAYVKAVDAIPHRNVIDQGDAIQAHCDVGGAMQNIWQVSVFAHCNY